MSAHGHNAIEAPMLQRIYGEFLEMPGLRLTCQQAQRLWGLDEQTCSDLLELLVDARFLYQPSQGMYMRWRMDTQTGRGRGWPRRLDVAPQKVKEAG